MSTTVYMHTLGCPKNRVDSEVMLGSWPQRGLPPRAGARRGRRHRREHLRVHREREGGVGRRDPRARRARSGTGAARSSSSPAASRSATTPSSRASCRRWTTSSAPAPTPRSRASSQDAQAKRIVVPDPDFVHAATTPRVNSLPVAHRLPEDLRGLRQRLRVLHHPAAARAAALAADRRHRRRGRGGSRAQGVGRALARRAGPHRVRPRPPGQGRGCTTSCRRSARWTGSAGSGSTTPTRATSPTRSST